MPAKAPIYLKNAGGNKGNKKLREILSTDMISAPLGDFRHTAHVGRGGSRDMFGDTSFIPNQDCLTTILPSQSDAAKDEVNGTEHLDETCREEISDQSEDQANALQSALSLPHLKTTDNGNIPESPHTLNKVYSKSQENISKVETPPESPSSTNETEQNVTEGPPKPKRVLSKVSHTPQNEPSSSVEGTSSFSGPSSPSRANIENSDNTDDWKFELDMGPSLVDEIMGIIEMTRPSQ